MDQENIHKDFALIDEIDSAIKLIKLGLGELQNFSMGNSFHHLPFQLLSSGFERYMKCYICLAHLNLYNKYPNSKYIKNIGHDLYELLAEINANYYVVDPREMMVKDRELLTSDSEFLELLHILSEFGKMARYHNLDVITGSPKISIKAKQEWQNFESKILQSKPDLYDKIMNNDTQYEVYDYLSTYIIKIFEHFLGALARQCIFGYLGDRAKQITLAYTDFGTMYEKDFGKTDYRKQTTKYQQTPRKKYKRTFFDEFERRTNSNYKSKKISKVDYRGEWPFYADEIIIECRYKNWSVVTIDGYDYALNGSAKGRYKLDDPYEGGMIIPGMTFSEFNQMAREL